jgi:hypothetical protein
MRARSLLAALGFTLASLSCGEVRNSEFGVPANRIEIPTDDAGFAECNCVGGLCCGGLCCNLTDLCCLNGPGPRCIAPSGVNTTCNDFPG